MTPQLYSLVTGIKTLFAKHHPVIFITIVGLLLAAAVFSLYQILDITSAPTTPSSTTPVFDKATVDKIKKLHDSSDTTENLVFPTPRSNPFKE
jgi:hypothetical protein